MDPTTNDTSAPNWGPALDNDMKSQAMAVVAAGALVANLPIVSLINMYGPRYIFTFVGLFGKSLKDLKIKLGVKLVLL